MQELESLHRDLLSANVFPEKRFSQNFLINPEILDLLVEKADISPKDHVIEIGGGTGVVTQKIAETNARVTVLEVHPKLIPFLQKKFASHKNVDVIGKDFLHVELDSIPFTHVCCSPPYAIADDIMLGLFHHGFKTASMVWQMEFAEKLIAPPGSQSYGPLSVICQYFYDGTIAKKISPQSFYPSPQQFSAILVLKARKKVVKLSDYDLFVLFLRTLFRFKNKTVLNAVQHTIKHLKAEKNEEKILKIVKEMDWEDLKVFLLEPEELVELFEEVAPLLPSMKR
ncbi:MAG: ribosomal RNA small subunit methyltransferase A [Candidatus Iainarchaeum archaeon]|uniref:Ribosomal RNA small subunit methyltransferase A n=1 Tax=Candidatus Iainarchaeum sp. TaxID=3101447 RepID=A0A7T9DKR3_9ARCH|nr:MAG: ribosomal RNA small subunit methyltransferase A [Candidatus Diapherotrites archaeon]